MPKHKSSKTARGLYCRGGIWYMDIRTEGGSRIRRSLGTENYQEAERLLNRVKHELQQELPEQQPQRLWDEAAAQWIKEKSGKKSINADIGRLRHLAALRGKTLAALDRRFIMETVAALPCGSSTKNRYLALIRSILNRAADEWGWLDKIPKLTLYREPKKRVRWLKPAEAERLLDALAAYPLLHDLAVFSLATGLRQRNVLDLKWEQVDLNRRTAWINADEAKGGQAIAVPLNRTALQVLALRPRRSVYVFTQNNGKRPYSISSRIWKNCLKEAGIENFRWHDLRHTWASWLIQSGVPMAVLKELGGWQDAKMVERYAHLSSEHLAEHAAVLDTIWTHVAQNGNDGAKENRPNDCLGGENVVGRERFERSTNGLKVRCSTG